MALAERLSRAQCLSRSGVTPSKARAPSNTLVPSQKACVRGPTIGWLPSSHSPSRKVKVCDQADIAFDPLRRGKSADVAFGASLMGFGRPEPARIEPVPGQSSGTISAASAPSRAAASPIRDTRDNQIGRDLGQRDQDEGPVEQFGMRQGQPFGLEGDVAVGDEVDVDDPRPPSLRGLRGRARPRAA